MASTISLTGDWLSSAGNSRSSKGTGNLGVYATGGITITAAQVGLGRLSSLIVDPAGGYLFEYVASTGKVKAYYGNGGLVDHTHDILLIGGITATEPVAAFGGDTLGKNAATNRTIAGAASATKGGVVTSGAGSAGAGVEVTNAVDLSGITFNFRASGV